jgi:hypothetical protein
MKSSSFLRCVLGAWMGVNSGRSVVRRARSAPLSLHEALEPRLVLSVPGGSPPVVMLSATATDSRSIMIDYRVSQALSPNQPLPFGVYRSSDSRFDAQDVPVGSWQVGALAPGQAGTLLDDNGQPADAPGTHHLTIPLPGGLPPDPQKPYVLVVADPASPSALSDPAQTASFHTHVIGIVTHGGLQNPHWKFGPAWQAQTAAILKSQGYDAVIAYNWVADSNHAGRAVTQGPRLASQILAVASQFPASDPVDLHFIGHSEGAVVNTQAIVQLEGMMTPQLKAGFIKDTLLDPHAANNAVPGQQYSLGKGVLEPLALLAKGEIDSFQSKARDPAVFVPSVVNDAEVFYQHTSAANAHGVNGGIYNLWGQVPVNGPAHYFNLTAAGATHAGKTGVSQWYANFVAPTLGDQAPWIQSLRLSGQIDNVDMATIPATAPARARVTGSDRVLHDSQPEFSGTAAPNSTVRLYVGPTSKPSGISPAGWTTADSMGHWALTTRPLTAGRYRAVAMDFSRASRTRPGLTIIPTLPLGSFVVAPQMSRGQGG